MSFETIPSKPLHFFDVPEVKSLNAEFIYNFFVADESIDESGNESLRGNLSPRFLRKGTIDTSNMNARIPRYVELKFGLGDTKKKMGGSRSRSRKLRFTKEKILEAINSGKVVIEDDASSNRYMSSCFGNSNLSSELENFMRVSLNKYTLEESSIQEAIVKFSTTTNVNSSYLSSVLTPPSLNGRPDNKVFKRHLRRLSNTKNQVQLNSTFAPYVLRKSVERGTSLNNSDISSRYIDSVNNMKANTEFFVTEDESVFDIPSTDLQKQEGVFVPEAYVVGVFFEKNRIYKGKKYPMPAVLVTGESPSSAFDSEVAYGQTYEYVARTIAVFRIPATSEDGRTFVQTMMVASKPSPSVQLTLTEDRAPEPPQDVNYYYEYDSESLYITWAPPVNPQRDVKYYQVFRRKTIEEPFELIAHLDFDDSVIRSESVEAIDPTSTLSFSSMPTFYVDPEFGRDTSYIYSLVAVDARKISSAYSTQVRVSFDQHKNKIKKDFVCYSGAPKQYPNWTIKENFFVDSMKDSTHTKVNIYFNPEAYTVIKGDGEAIPAFYPTTVDPLAKYVFQFINTDRLLEEKFEAIIDDSSFKKDAVEGQDIEKDDDE